MSSGIYQIKNTITGKCYIGSGVSIGNRWSNHLTYLRRGSHYNTKLQYSWNKHGEIAFIFRILVIVERNQLETIEQKCIDSYDSCQNGYNIRPKAENNFGYKHTEETKLNMSIAADEVAMRPGEAKRRSGRAKSQHEEKNFGWNTWSEETKKAHSETARNTAIKHELWKHSFKNKSHKEIWTPEMRAAAAERQRQRAKPKPEIIKICPVCRDEFKTKKIKRKFCSAICAGLGNWT